MNEELPEPAFWEYPSPSHRERVACYTAEQVRELVRAAKEQERERWTHGAKISIPTDAMEQEFASYERRGRMAERERCAKLCEGLRGPFLNNSEIHDEFQFCAAAIRSYPA